MHPHRTETQARLLPAGKSKQFNTEHGVQSLNIVFFQVVKASAKLANIAN